MMRERASRFPESADTPAVTVDLREGGLLTFEWPDGPSLEFRFLRMMTPTMLEHTHPSPGSWMRYELVATDQRTLLP